MISRSIITSIVVTMILLMSGCAQAKPQIVSWSWPTTDCDGIVLLQTDLVSADLVYDLSPMPMPSDSDGGCGITEDPDAPTSAASLSLPIGDTSIILNLKPGETYFARMRVSAYIDGNWSAWSDELQFTVPYGRPNRVIISDGWLQYEAELLTDPVIRFN